MAARLRGVGDHVTPSGPTSGGPNSFAALSALVSEPLQFTRGKSYYVNALEY